MFYPLDYDEPLFRPPAEANSAILQLTLGCSWNKCAFCEMYTSKDFRVRKFEEIQPEIAILSKLYGWRKIFLADGNAFVLSANKLIPVLEEINKQFGKVQRISSYALPKDILSKSDTELKQLKELGLKLLYIGIETGDDELLQLIRKGETFETTKEGILKAHQAGIETSIMIINGLGGRKYSNQHALKSAAIINEINPKFLSTLTLSLPYGLPHFKNRFEGVYEQQTIRELFDELKLFLKNINGQNIIFRSNHVSNNLALKGILSKDNDALIQEINEAMKEIPSDIYPTTSGML